MKLLPKDKLAHILTYIELGTINIKNSETIPFPLPVRWLKIKKEFLFVKGMILLNIILSMIGKWLSLLNLSYT